MISIKFKIATPEKVVYENSEVKQVSIPTVDGEITVLPNHIPLISILKPGELRIVDNAGSHAIAVSGGFVEIRNNNDLVVLADHAERAAEIDVERARLAKQRAAEQMEKIKNVQDVDYARLQAVIEREMNRLVVGNKYKRLPKSE